MASGLGCSNIIPIALATVLALFFGYSLRMVPLLRGDVALASAMPFGSTPRTRSPYPYQIEIAEPYSARHTGRDGY